MCADASLNYDQNSSIVLADMRWKIFSEKVLEKKNTISDSRIIIIYNK